MKKFLSVFLSLIFVFSLCVPAFAQGETEVPNVEASTFTYGDYTLAYTSYESVGEQKGQILLLHGFALSSASMKPLALQYSQVGYKTICLDLPNFGSSSRETAKTNLLSREEIVYALMESLGGKWILGGHSMGGGIALNVAVAHPETVCALFLFAPVESKAPGAFESFIYRSLPVRLMYSVLVSAIASMPFVARAAAVMAYGSKELADKCSIDEITAPLKAKGTGAGIAMMTSHTLETKVQEFSSLEIPVVIINTVDDSVAPKASKEAFLNGAPETAKAFTFQQGGHMFFEAFPEETAQASLSVIA